MKDYNAVTLLIFGLGFLAGKNFNESYPKKFMKGNLFLQKHHSVTGLTFHVLTLTAISIHRLFSYIRCQKH